MSYSLPKYYFRDIPAYLMDEIIAGMIDGKQVPKSIPVPLNLVTKDNVK